MFVVGVVLWLLWACLMVVMHMVFVVVGRGLMFVAADAVTGPDLQRVGEKLMESNPSMAVIGNLQNIPARHEVEAALHSNGGMLTKQKTSFSFF